MPEPASSTLKPPGAWITASSSVALPVKTSCRVILGCRFSTTSRLARPRSASSTSTRWPRRVRAAARLADTKVLPTPPLPLVMAMMRAPVAECEGEAAPAGAAGGGGGGGGGGARLFLLLLGAARWGWGAGASFFFYFGGGAACGVGAPGGRAPPPRGGVERAKQQAFLFGTDS